jgi:7,8-dihydropterin-6-yl-methyl-4-(beta-D-ribofuranosyl)aminobenzene 5'-phosphate synthase
MTGIKLTVLFDNRDFNARLETAWGFSCLIQGTHETILFDTGSDGSILMANMIKLGIEPSSIGMVFITHDHWDHTGGLERILRFGIRPQILLPASFSDDTAEHLASLGGKVTRVSGPQALCSRVWSCGESGKSIREHSMVIDTQYGAVVLTGCAHPGIVSIADRVHKIGQGDITLLMGGFHLMGANKSEVQSVVDDLKRLWVLRVAPSHCTGDDAIAIFRREFGPDFVHIGVGSSVTL